MHSDGLTTALLRNGFVLRQAAESTAMIGAEPLSAWPAFAATWNGMELDRHMADGGRYRRRRHAILSAMAGVPGLRREIDGPHWQAVDHNPLNGGGDRHFEPIPPETTAGAAFQAIAGWARAAFDAAEPGRDWYIEAHQFRIEARAGSEGRPTPEGMHRDGVDWVLVTLVRRENVAEGVTAIASPDGRPLGTFTLEAPMDSMLLDDRRVQHGVTPIRPLDPGHPGWRDVLVVTFRRR